MLYIILFIKIFVLIYLNICLLKYINIQLYFYAYKVCVCVALNILLINITFVISCKSPKFWGKFNILAALKL